MIDTIKSEQFGELELEPSSLKGSQSQIWYVKERPEFVVKTIANFTDQHKSIAESIQKLSSNEIVPIHEIGQTEINGEPFGFIIMRRATEPLDSGWDRNEKKKQWRKLLLQAARGVQTLHANNIVHRAIKPTNILCFEDSVAGMNELQARIADFGVVEVFKKPRGTHTAFMAPETWKGGGAAPADVWSFGAIMFKLTSGRHPFDPEQDIEALLKKYKSNPALEQYAWRAHFAQHCGDVDEYFVDIAIRCLDPVPRRRPRMHEVVEALQEERAPTRRSPPIALVPVLVLVLAVVILVTALRVDMVSAKTGEIEAAAPDLPSEPEPEFEPEPKPEPEPEPKPKPELKPKLEPKPKPELEPELKPKLKPKPEPGPTPSTPTSPTTFNRAQVSACLDKVENSEHSLRQALLSECIRAFTNDEGQPHEAYDYIEGRRAEISESLPTDAPPLTYTR